MALCKINFAPLDEIKAMNGVGETKASLIKQKRQQGFNITPDDLGAWKLTKIVRLFDFEVNPDVGEVDDADESSEEELDVKQQTLSAATSGTSRRSRHMAQVREVRVPKNLEFSGAEDWRAFQLKFLRFLGQNRINREADQMYYFGLTLTGRASIFFEKSQHRSDLTMDEVYDSMKKRFGKVELENSAIMKMRTAAQKESEDIHDFADRLWDIAEMAYPTQGEAHMEKHVLVSLIMGLKDRKAVRHLSTRGIKTVAEAIEAYEMFAHARLIAKGELAKPREVKVNKLDYEEGSSSSESEDSEQEPVRQVRQVKKNSFKEGARFIPNSKNRQEEGDKAVVSALKEMTGEFRNMASEIRNLVSEVRNSTREIMEDLREMRTELRSEMTQMRTEMGGKEDPKA